MYRRYCCSYIVKIYYAFYALYYGMTREETNNKNKTSVQNTTFCNDLSLSFEDEYVAEPLCVYSRFSQFVETKDYARIGSWNNGQLLLLSRLQSHHPIIHIPHIKKPVSRIMCYHHTSH
jgi:hypothetical protein